MHPSSGHFNTFPSQNGQPYHGHSQFTDSMPHQPDTRYAYRVHAEDSYSTVPQSFNTNTYTQGHGADPSYHYKSGPMPPAPHHTNSTESPSYPTLPPTQAARNHSPPNAQQPHHPPMFEKPKTHRIVSAEPVHEASHAARAASDEELNQPLASAVSKKRSAATTAPNPKRMKSEPKIKAKGRVKGHNTKSDGEEVDAPVRKGRKPGATGYSENEVNHLLRLIEKFLPLGGKAWESVTVLYNHWAAANGHSERTSKAIKAKFDSLCGTKKPTGDAEVPDCVEKAWTIEEAINQKSGFISLDDPEWEDVSDREDVVEISSASDPETTKPAQSKTHVTKAFRANSLMQPSQRRSRTAATALDALSSLTSAFSPAAMKEREDNKLLQIAQITQFSSQQSELREARQCIDELNAQLLRETLRAEKAENQLEFFKYMKGHLRPTTPHSPRASSYYASPHYAYHSPPSETRHYHVRSPMSPARRRQYYQSRRYPASPSRPSGSGWQMPSSPIQDYLVTHAFHEEKSPISNPQAGPSKAHPSELDDGTSTVGLEALASVAAAAHLQT